MRRPFVALALLLAVGSASAAAAQTDAPFVDVIEIAGVIDRPLVRYATERIDEAEREGASLLVFQIDSLGGLKVSDEQLLPPLVRRVRDARIPVAVWVGPRDGRAAGMTLFLAQAAHIASISNAASAGPLHPVDLGRIDRWPAAAELEGLRALGTTRGRRVTADPARVYRSREAVQVGLFDSATFSVAQLLEESDGARVTTAAGTETLSLPRDQIDVRFHQPGPLRRLLHTFSNATLVYILLLGGAMLLVFELFQPGFGVAGVTAGLLLAAAGYGITVLPVRAGGLALLLAGLVLLGVDVALDRIGTASVLGAAGLLAGSLMTLPRGYEALRIPVWVIALGVAATLVMFLPVMTVVRRARAPIGTGVKRELIGEPGQVRSLLNPEGFVLVREEIWRARSEDGRRMRVGEPVVVTGVEGTVLMVRAPVAADPDLASPDDGASPGFH